MKGFFRELITSRSGVSSKRFIALMALVLIAAITTASICGVAISGDIVWGLVTLCLTSAGLTAIPYKNENKKGDDISYR